jgi:hypothetical protein
MPNSIDRYTLVGPQIGIRGNPTPQGAVASTVEDKDLSTFRMRGGFASTVLAFNVYKQVLPDLKLSIKLALWAGIQNALNNNVRQFNDSASVDFREQYMDLSGSWGSVWGGRRIGLFNRGGMRMNWFLMHQHGIGHPCNVDGSGTAQCGHTGVGSMFPNRNAQIGYATPEVAGMQLSVAMFDGAMINEQWNLTQIVGRTQEVAQQPAVGHPGIPADKTINVWGVGGGAWGRFGGFGLGGTGWYGAGLGTATPFGNTAVDDIGMLRKHFGYLAIANFRVGKFEIAASYGSTNVQETDWDKNPNPAISDKVSVIKQVRGIGGKLAYHIVPAVVFSIDGLNLHHTWWRNETQNANVVSGGLVAKW